MRKQGSRFLPSLVAVCAVASVTLILWSQRPTVLPKTASPLAAAPAVAPEKKADTPAPAAQVAPAPASPAVPAPEIAGSSKSAPVPTPAGSLAAGVNAGLPPAPADAKPAPPPLQPPEAMHAEPLLDLATIASQPQLWPAEIVLVTPVEFPIFVNGKQAGSAELPRGTSVTLRRVNADGTLEVQRQGATARIPARSTNLLRLLQGGSAGQAATANTSKPVAQTAARPAATPSGPRQMLEVSVSPDPTADVDIDSQGNRLKSYRIRIVNATEQNYPKVLVRFFAFARNATDEVTLAANDEQVCNVGPNTELIVLPAKLRILKGRGIDGTAVLLRDGDNNIIGSQTTRDSVTKNWPALESLPPGSPVP